MVHGNTTGAGSRRGASSGAVTSALAALTLAGFLSHHSHAGSSRARNWDFTPRPAGCRPLLAEGGCKAGLTSEDEILLFAPAVREAIREAWDLSNPGCPAGWRQEAGFVVLRDTTGDVVPTLVRASGSADRLAIEELDLPGYGRRSGDVAQAVVHTHPLGGLIGTNPLTGASGYWSPCHSSADLRVARSVRLPLYVVTNGGIYGFDPRRDAVPAPVVCGVEFEAYLGIALSGRADAARAPATAEDGLVPVEVCAERLTSPAEFLPRAIRCDVRGAHASADAPLSNDFFPRGRGEGLHSDPLGGADLAAATEPAADARVSAPSHPSSGAAGVAAASPRSDEPVASSPEPQSDAGQVPPAPAGGSCELP